MLYKIKKNFFYQNLILTFDLIKTLKNSKMKGTVIYAFKEFIEKNYGNEKWRKILQETNLDPNLIIILTDDFDDNLIMKLINNATFVLKRSLSELIDRFADYWINEYTCNLYQEIYERYKSYKDFILDLNKIHTQLTAYIPGANPPKFDIKVLDNNTIQMKYISKRNMIDFAIANLKKLAKRFHTYVQVTKISDDTIVVFF